MNLNVAVLAGVAGFEPTNDGIKNRCLTAWRHPNEVFYTQILHNFFYKVKTIFLKLSPKYIFILKYQLFLLTSLLVSYKNETIVKISTFCIGGNKS